MKNQLRPAGWPLSAALSTVTALAVWTTIQHGRLALGEPNFAQLRSVAAGQRELLKLAPPLLCGQTKGDLSVLLAALVVPAKKDKAKGFSAWEEPTKKPRALAWGVIVGATKVLFPAFGFSEELANEHSFIMLNDESVQGFNYSKTTKSYYNQVISLDHPIKFNLSAHEMGVNRVCVERELVAHKASEAFVIAAGKMRTARPVLCPEFAGSPPRGLVCVSRKFFNKEPDAGDILVARNMDRFWLLGIYSSHIGRNLSPDVWAFNSVGELEGAEPL